MRHEIGWIINYLHLKILCSSKHLASVVYHPQKILELLICSIHHQSIYHLWNIFKASLSYLCRCSSRYPLNYTIKCTCWPNGLIYENIYYENKLIFYSITSINAHLKKDNCAILFNHQRSLRRRIHYIESWIIFFFN